uniref:Uncharacterized protein n=1 Tax=Physcomitrium patens TaxID=3218 RepID=A0A2K1L4H8_PHYPA|nr:hypothetical protein PHYPA_003728 [Physcomitrium patens]
MYNLQHRTEYKIENGLRIRFSRGLKRRECSSSIMLGPASSLRDHILDRVSCFHSSRGREFMGRRSSSNADALDWLSPKSRRSCI